ncbi:MAG: cupin domain-containing protein [Candidatus Eremiobacteraeota bacterium]|nr:cupin domain-containing protein [Candidatus Eremiobacteraeota bacterium]
MQKVNTKNVEEEIWTSPKGKFHGAGREISIALGRKPRSTDISERHPFDVEIARIPPGATPYPYHSHSAQWEFYHVISGRGIVRHEDGTTEVEEGDAFIFKPGEAHVVSNNGGEDLIMYVVADNPIGESWYYPDSGKWGVASPDRCFIRSDSLDYFDGEE